MERLSLKKAAKLMNMYHGDLAFLIQDQVYPELGIALKRTHKWHYIIYKTGVEKWLKEYGGLK